MTGEVSMQVLNREQAVALRSQGFCMTPVSSFGMVCAMQVLAGFVPCKFVHNVAGLNLGGVDNTCRALVDSRQWNTRTVLQK